VIVDDTVQDSYRKTIKVYDWIIDYFERIIEEARTDIAFGPMPWSLSEIDHNRYVITDLRSIKRTRFNCGRTTLKGRVCTIDGQVEGLR
jgi:hypothetical protein